jgi:1,3-propanediol dehydrogenase
MANAMLLPHVCKYNMIANLEKFADIAEFMGEKTSHLSTIEAAEKAIQAMFRLSSDVGIPSSLKEIGIKEEDIELMSINALKDGNAFSNPRKGNEKDVANIFRAAM